MSRRALAHSVILTAMIVSFSVSLAVAEIPQEKKKSRKTRYNWVVLPVLSYAPETGIAVGAGALVSVRPPTSLEDGRPSSLGALAIITQKKQYQLSLAPDVYLKNETYHFFGYVDFFKFVDKFYGIGGQTRLEDEEIYSSRFVHWMFDLQKRVRPHLYAGLRQEFLNFRVTEFEGEGNLSGGLIPGTEPHTASGIGAVLNWDSRDHIYSPGWGSFHQASWTLFRPAWGSDYRFSRSVLDLRKYISPSEGHVLAFQGYLSAIAGDPPFEMLSLLGGPLMMRGYWMGRYRDKHMMVFQSEYRLHVWRRWGLAAFAAVGEVTDKLGGFQLKNFKASYGLGLRFVLNTEESLSLRLDMGFGRDSSGFYVTVMEAF